jgi:hypothetical protein
MASVPLEQAVDQQSKTADETADGVDKEAGVLQQWVTSINQQNHIIS